MARSRRGDGAVARPARAEVVGSGRTQVVGWPSLERQESQKSASVTSGMPPTIVINDDDDDIHISSPRSFAQARSALSSSRQRSRAAVESRPPADNRGPTDDLELRLGPTNFNQSTARRIRMDRPRVPAATLTIDLTKPSPSYDADCILVNEFVQKKRKPAPVVPEPAKELKLTCAICMDTMKDETSTICGHIFCKKCITGAITVQKRCPSCRQPLHAKQTHRIYISGSLRA